jgi:hypothetical protein
MSRKEDRSVVSFGLAALLVLVCLAQGFGQVSPPPAEPRPAANPGSASSAGAASVEPGSAPRARAAPKSRPAD